MRPPEAAGAGSAAHGRVHALLASGTRAPEAYADALRNHPAARDEILMLLQRTIGHGAVQQILAAVAEPRAAGAGADSLAGGGGELPLGPVRVNAPHGLRVRHSPHAGNDDNVIGLLAHEQTVTTTRREGEWLATEHHGQPAFINGHHVEPVAKPAVAPHGSTPAAAQVSTPTTTHASTPTATQASTPTAAQASTPTATHAETPMFGHVGGMSAAPAPVAPIALPVVVSPTAPHEATPPTAAPAPKVDATPAHAPAPAATQVEVPEVTPEQARHRVKDQAYIGRALDDQSYLSAYHHLNGEGTLADEPTKPKEAEVLNALRASNKRLDPAYLVQLQDRINVKNNSGAFNTETLRRLRSFKGDEHATAETILDGAILRKHLDGNPFIDVGRGGGAHSLGSASAVATGHSKADGMAMAAGFANYKELHNDIKPMKLLEQNVGTGSSHLRARLAVADQWLKNRHPLDANNKTWADVAKNKIGWSGKGHGSYADSEDEIAKFGFEGGVAVGPHMHSSGLAIDIDTAQNPYVFAGENMDKDGPNEIMAKHLRQAAQIYGGEAVTPANLWKWSHQSSTEELHARVDAASQSLRKYLVLAETGSDSEIRDLFVAKAGFTPAEAEAAVAGVRHFGKKGFIDENWKGGKRYFQDNLNRTEATGLTNMSTDLLVALRDVAGLAWGGGEMSESGESGDFMHFDCRNDTMGANVLQFAYHNNTPPPVDPAAVAAGVDHHKKK
jgi:hypothetical protein